MKENVRNIQSSLNSWKHIDLMERQSSYYMACFKNYKTVISDEQTVNKYLNVFERVEVVERVKDAAYPYYTVSR